MRAEISSIFGLEVYTDRGKYVGRVDDVVLDVEQRRIRGLALSNIDREFLGVSSNGVIVPYRWVVAVGDIVILKHVFRKRRRKEEEQ